MKDSAGADISVVSVNISDEKGTSKRPVDAIVMDEEGILGDGHRGPHHRQVSFLDTGSIDRFAEKAGREFAPGEFAENITTRGLDFTCISVFDRIRIGEVDLEVTQIGKECHGDVCAIFREVGACVMPKEGFFCRVETGGTVRSGDVLEHIPETLVLRVVTISDRVSRGEAEDRSGPKIVSMLNGFFEKKPWRVKVGTSVVSDDADRIEAELITARDAGADVIVTTGGTGVGPRDVTPDVVGRLADKTIPGVMEHIRLKFGADKPNALLSRSVAAVCGTTLVYALPGSAKAVEEYMGEIFRTLEHTILMLRKVDAH